MHHIICEDIEILSRRLKPQLSHLARSSICITGAGGMIASYLVNLFVHANRTTLKDGPISLYLITKNPVLENSRLGHLLGEHAVSFICADVTQPFTLPAGITHIIHAASWANPKKYLSHPIETMDTNVVGARQLLQYATANPLQKILFLSSVEVYGNPDPSSIPTSESYVGRVDPVGARSCYAEAKRYVECLAAHFFRVHGVPSVIARLSHTYGPGLSPDDSRVIGTFMRYAREGNAIQIFGDGIEKRTFSYVSDTCAALLTLLTEGVAGEVYNVGSDTECVTMNDLATIISDEWHLTAKAIHVIDQKKEKYLKGAPQRVQPDLSKIRALGWVPAIPLRAGLRRLREWFIASV